VKSKETHDHIRQMTGMPHAHPTHIDHCPMVACGEMTEMEHKRKLLDYHNGLLQEL
jgi:hypothetical protein